MLSQQPFLIRLRHNIVRFLCEGLNNIFVPVAYQSSSSRVSKKSKFFYATLFGCGKLYAEGTLRLFSSPFF